MSSRDREKEKDREKKHRKSSSSSSSGNSKSSSSSDSKKKKSSSHKSSSRTTQNTRRDTPNDELNEQNDNLQLIEEDGQEDYTESMYYGNSNAADTSQRYPAPIGYTHAWPSSRSELPSRREPPVSSAVTPSGLSQTQRSYTVSAYTTQPTNTSPVPTLGESNPISLPYYTTQGVRSQTQQVPYNSQPSYAQTTNPEQPPGGLGATYSLQRNQDETHSEFPNTSDLARAINETASYTHVPQDPPPAGPDSTPRRETRTQPWQLMQQNLHHRPLEPWNEDPKNEGTISDDTNRVKREDDITGS